MGVKYLWSIFSPYSERKPLDELRGKTVAIDLSCWICEAQNLTDYYIQPRMYLRNLYFRTCYLLLMDVRPVFVLEGAAPALKFDTIAARNQVQFKGARPRAPKTQSDDATNKREHKEGRSRFDFVLKQCEQMLKLLGLACVRGRGEAEALCAHLNRKNLVDGCISQDSDCFAYGATVVYRNFSISKQGATTSIGGSVEIYDLNHIRKRIDFGRNKVVALAVLCGCDYSDGVTGVGKESALKLFETVAEEEILGRLRAWETQTERYDELQRRIDDKNVCTSCGHAGKVSAHAKKGCARCKTNTGCASTYKDERQTIKNELSVRAKALACTEFPNQRLLDEFLADKESVAALDLRWRRPDLHEFVKFSVKHLQWEVAYAFEKCLPILTRWQLLHANDAALTNHSLITLEPKLIKKTRKTKGILSYEIIWGGSGGKIAKLLNDPSLDVDTLLTTIEPQHLVESAHAQLVDDFQMTKNAKKTKKKAPAKRKKDKVAQLGDILSNVSISEPQPKQQKRQNRLDSYFATDKSGSEVAAQGGDASKFGDEDDLDVSDVVEGIISAPAPSVIAQRLQEMDGARADDARFDDGRESSFFLVGEDVHDEVDVFEMSMNQPRDNDDESDEEFNVTDTSTPHKTTSDSEDSFCNTYVPLIDRIKSKLTANG